MRPLPGSSSVASLSALARIGWVLPWLVLLWAAIAWALRWLG